MGGGGLRFYGGGGGNMRFMVGLIPHSDFVKLQSSDDFARNDPGYSHDISQSHTKLLMIKNTYHHWLFNRVKWIGMVVQ